MKPTGIIYQATNTVNGKRYIGASRFSLKKRWAEHRYSAATGRKTWFYDALRKYGIAAFDVVQIATCLAAPSEVERLIIQAEKPEYNQTNGGEITSGRKHSPETVAKIAAGNRGKKRTPEQNAANSARKKALYANNPEYRAATIERLKIAGAKVDETKRIEAVRVSAKNRLWSEESKAKLSASCTGRSYGAEVHEKIATKKRKKIECITLGLFFPSILDASRALGISNSYIGKVCDGRANSAGGHKFRYANI